MERERENGDGVDTPNGVPTPSTGIQTLSQKSRV
ncbi:hypothetical protein JOD21_000475 [Jeotgalibacillus terrae]|nr:hypothetical protein [Jeotgalibacillus terrae]